MFELECMQAGSRWTVPRAWHYIHRMHVSAEVNAHRGNAHRGVGCAGGLRHWRFARLAARGLHNLPQWLLSPGPSANKQTASEPRAAQHRPSPRRFTVPFDCATARNSPQPPSPVAANIRRRQRAMLGVAAANLRHSRIGLRQRPAGEPRASGAASRRHAAYAHE